MSSRCELKTVVRGSERVCETKKRKKACLGGKGYEWLEGEKEEEKEERIK